MFTNTELFSIEAKKFKKDGRYCDDPHLSPPWMEYWNTQLTRCKEGYSVGGTRITGNHYFYLNFCRINLTSEEGEKVSRSRKKNLAFPDFWDGDYEYFHIVDKAKEQAKHLCLGKSRRKGFQQPHSEIIITPTGETSMGNIKPGDQVINQKGNPVKVLEVFFQGECDVYEVEFRDGRKVKCGKEHLWSIIEFKGKNKTVQTDFFIGKKLIRNKGKANQYYSYHIPNNEAVKFSEKFLPIDPYILGLLIGDGSMTQGSLLFSTNDVEILDRIQEKLSLYSIHKKSTPFQYSICYNGKVNPILREIRKLELNCRSEHKFIPEIYKYGSVEQRLELLQGLMDTDGTSSPTGTVRFTTASKKLKDDVEWLVRSLGIKVKTYHTLPENSFAKFIIYNLNLVTDLPVFKLKRKLKNVRKDRKYNFRKIGIKSVKKLDYKEKSSCILVEDNEHLYLTKDFIVTHNSFKNSSICANRYNTQRNSTTVIGAFDKKYLFPTGTMSMTLDYLNFLNEHTGWAKKSQVVNKQDFRRASYKQLVDGIEIEKGYKSQVIALTFKDNPSAARGKDASLFLFEECGNWPNLKAAYLATKPTVEDGIYTVGQIILFGCVCAGTKVWEKDGKFINIEDLRKEDGILGYNSKNILKQNINWLKLPSEKECYKIDFIGKNTLSCSFDHPLLVRKDRHNDYCEFIKAENLKLGYQVLCPKKVNVFGKKNLKDSYFIGLMIGDGYYSKAGVFSISISSDSIYKYITKNYKTTPKKRWKISAGEYRELSVSCKRLKKVFNTIGILGQSKDRKRLPENLHTFNKKSLANLLAGLFDADGNIRNYKSGRIVLTSVIKELLEQVQGALVKFGIYSSISKEKRNTLPPKGYEGQKPYIYRLYICKREDIELFKHYIPIKSQNKIDALNSLLTRKTNRKFNVIKKIKFKYKEEYPKGKFFKDLILKDLRYNTICSINNIGQQKVYNLNTTPTHTYLTNFLISGNTGGSMEQGGTLDFYEMFYNPEPYNLMAFNNIWDEDASGTCGYFFPDYQNKAGFIDSDGNSKKEEAKEFEEARRQVISRKSKDKKTLTRHITEYAFNPREAFFLSTANIFPVADLKHRLGYLESSEKMKNADYIGDLIIEEEGKVKWKENNKLVPITEFPLRHDTITEGCIVIYNMPYTDENDKVPSGMYLGSMDPYSQDQAETSSLGSTFIYDKVNKKIVAEYTARPATSRIYYENAKRLFMFYNCRCLYENQIKGPFDYFESKYCLYLLADEPDIIHDIIQDSKVVRKKGMHMTEALKDYGENLISQWLLEEREDKLLNLHKIRSIPLLKELIFYKPGINCDRVIALMLVLYYEAELRKQKVSKSVETETIYDDPFWKRDIYKKKLELA